MRLKHCPECGHRIQAAAPFCEDCGIDLEIFRGNESGSFEDSFKASLKSMIDDLIDNNSEIIKEIAEKVKSGEPVDKGMFFAVEMGDGKPKIKTGDIMDLERFLRDSSLSPFIGESASEGGELVFKEVKPEVSENGDVKKIRIAMPGVNANTSTVIRRMPDGFEVIASVDGTIYFSKVALAGDLKIKSKRFESESLVIEVR